MNDSQTKIEIYIGAFILAGVIIISGMIMFMGSGGGLFSSTYKVIVEIEHVGDLRVGAPIKLGGYMIGRVVDIRMAKSFIEIECDIDSRRDLAVDCSANITAAGLVGDNFLEFTKGKSRNILKKNGEIKDAARVQGNGPVDMGRLFKQVETIGVEVTSIVKNLNDIVADEDVKNNIKEAIKNVNAGAMQANRLLVSLRRSADNVYTASENVSQTTQKVKRMTDTFESAINQTVGDKRNIDAINEMLANGRRISRKADSVLGEVERISQEQSENIKATIANIKDVTGKAKDIFAKMGPDKGVMRLFTSDDLKKDVEETIEWLKGFVSNEGVMTALQINRYANELATKRLKEWRSRYISADELEAKIRSNLRTGRDSIDDAKEVIRGDN